MAELVIYHNPRCSKSRRALALLEEQGLTPRVVRYLETPPGEDEIRQLLRKLGMAARDLVRQGEDDYRASGLHDRSTEDDIVAAMATFPKLIERPIVVHGERAALGRPPENVLALLR